MTNENQPDALVEVELMELCRSIVADGKVELDEIKTLRRWLRRHQDSSVPQVSILAELVGRIAADGKITRQEIEQLTEALHQVLGAQQQAVNIVEVACGSCAQRYQAQAQPQVQQLVCPACQAIVVVPAIGQPPAPPPANGDLFSDRYSARQPFGRRPARKPSGRSDA